MSINNNLSLHDHIKEAEKKLNFINFRLYPILAKTSFKLKVNLFKMMGIPQYRLAFQM